MSDTTLTSLLEYLYGALTPSNQRWLAAHLIEHAEMQDHEEVKPYTMEEINAMLDEAERQIAAGETIPDEDVWKELEEELAKTEPQYADAI